MNDILQPIFFTTDSNYTLRNKQIISKYRYWTTVIIDRTHLLPFEIIRAGIPTEKILMDSVKLYKIRGESSIYVSDIMQYLTFKLYGSEAVDNIYYKAAVYEGLSTIPALGQGDYYLVITEGTNTWTSSNFRSCFPRFTVTFEFSHPKSFNYLVHPITYKFSIESKISDTGDFLEVTEKYADDILNDTINFHKLDKVWECNFLADQNTYDAVRFMAMHNIIFVTDETGKREQIEITSFETEPISKSNHHSVTLKYRILRNQLLSTNKLKFYLQAIQEGDDFKVPDSGIYVGKKKIKVGNKKIII